MSSIELTEYARGGGKNEKDPRRTCLGPRPLPWPIADRMRLAETNKCVALSNKACAGGQATKKRENRAKRNDKRRASNRSDLPSGDVGLHRRCCGLRRDRVTTRANSYPSRIT